MISSYEENNYGEVLTAIVEAWRPLVCVELGVLHGYSTRAIAWGIYHNLKRGVPGHLDAYDLFDEYKFKHGNQEEVQRRLKDCVVLEDIVSLRKQDAYTVHTEYKDRTVYFLHVDISNTGETVQRIIELWDSKMVQGGIILFEGGTIERDQVDWMIKYNQKPIKPEIDTNKIIEAKYVYGTYLKYPGLTMLLKKQ